MRAERQRLQHVGTAADTIIIASRRPPARSRAARRAAQPHRRVWRPPWLETMMPSAPLSRASAAARAESTPFRTSRPFQRRRQREMLPASWSRSPTARTRSRDSTVGPHVAPMLSKWGMPWLSSVRSAVPNSQRGCGKPSNGIAASRSVPIRVRRR